MCCPYFEPVRPRTGTVGCPAESAMLPLGDVWAGTCRAIPAAPRRPDEAAIRPLCNLGYANGTCPSFPAGGGPDAVRFTVSRDDGASLGIYFVVERDHHPFAHGPLVYSLSAAAFVDEPPGPMLSSQARAYVESYLRRRKEGFPAPGAGAAR